MKTTPMNPQLSNSKPQSRDTLKAIFKSLSGHAKCTCETCPLEDTCEFSWDPYNSNGDCLAQK